MLEEFPDKKEDFLTPIKRNAERLYKLTQDILDIEKIESRNLKLEKTTFDMNEKINNVIRDLTTKEKLKL